MTAERVRGMIKHDLIWVALVIGIVIAYAAKNAFGVSDNAFSIAVLAFLLWAALGHIWYRLDTLEERVIHKDYIGIIAAIQEGERHVPQHQQPASLAAGGAVKSFITPAHELLFEDFRWFGAVMNQHVAEPWSIEELNGTDVRDWLADGPVVGRRYQVYYNACRMGTVQVTVDLLADRAGCALIDLNYLRFVTYEDAHSHHPRSKAAITPDRQSIHLLRRLPRQQGTYMVRMDIQTCPQKSSGQPRSRHGPQLATQPAHQRH